MGRAVGYNEAIKHCDVCCVELGRWAQGRWGATGAQVGGLEPRGLPLLLVHFHCSPLPPPPNCLTLGANVKHQEEPPEQNQREIS